MRSFGFVALAALSLMIACGKTEIGETCDDTGKTDECVDGAICTNAGSGAASACRKLCTEQAQCGTGEACNGISGSNQKSCQPE